MHPASPRPPAATTTRHWFSLLSLATLALAIALGTGAARGQSLGETASWQLRTQELNQQLAETITVMIDAHSAIDEAAARYPDHAQPLDRARRLTLRSRSSVELVARDISRLGSPPPGDQARGMNSRRRVYEYLQSMEGRLDEGLGVLRERLAAAEVGDLERVSRLGAEHYFLTAHLLEGESRVARLSTRDIPGRHPQLPYMRSLAVTNEVAASLFRAIGFSYVGDREGFDTEVSAAREALREVPAILDQGRGYTEGLASYPGLANARGEMRAFMRNLGKNYRATFDNEAEIEDLLGRYFDFLNRMVSEEALSDAQIDRQLATFERSMQARVEDRMRLQRERLDMVQALQSR